MKCILGYGAIPRPHRSCSHPTVSSRPSSFVTKPHFGFFFHAPCLGLVQFCKMRHHALKSKHRGQGLWWSLAACIMSGHHCAPHLIPKPPDPFTQYHFHHCISNYNHMERYRHLLLYYKPHSFVSAAAIYRRPLIFNIPTHLLECFILKAAPRPEVAVSIPRCDRGLLDCGMRRSQSSGGAAASRSLSVGVDMRGSLMC